MKRQTTRTPRWPLTACVCAIVGLLAMPAGAQTAMTDAQRVQAGQERAKLWCSHCHVVEPDGAAVAQSDVPSFESIAARPDQSVEKIENAVLNPHPPMPDLQLSRDMLRDLALYIMSLRRQDE